MNKTNITEPNLTFMDKQDEEHRRKNTNMTHKEKTRPNAPPHVAPVGMLTVC